MRAIPLLFLALIFAGVAYVGDNQPMDLIVGGVAAAVCVGFAVRALVGRRR